MVVPGPVIAGAHGAATVTLRGVATVTDFITAGVLSTRVLHTMASAIHGGGTIPYYPYYGDPYYGDDYYGDQYYQNDDPRISAIVAAQTALAQRGYYQGPIDGVLGPQTRAAIRSFQAHQGSPVTGQVDDRLIRALQS